jgi:PAS domain S-box-containing protein
MPPLDRDQAVAALTAFHDQLEQAEKKGLTAFEQAFHDPPPGVVGVHEIDLEHKVVRVSRHELGVLGYTEAEMVGHPVWEFIVMKEAAQRSIDQKFKGKKELKPFARTFRRADGQGLSMLLLDRHLLDKAGQLVGIRTVLVEVKLLE